METKIYKTPNYTRKAVQSYQSRIKNDPLKYKEEQKRRHNVYINKYYGEDEYLVSIKKLFMKNPYCKIKK